MRKVLTLIVIASLMLTAACSNPVGGNSDEETKTGETNESGLQDVSDENTAAAEASQQDTENQPSGDNGTSGEKVPGITVTLFYQDGEGYIVPVTRSLAKQEGIARASILALVDSSTIREELVHYGLYPIFPEGTEVRGINIKDGIATIDFNEKVLDYAHAADERNIVAATVYTLTGFETINGVRIIVNGESKGELKFGSDTAGILNRSNVLVNGKAANLAGGTEKVDIYLFRKANSEYTYLVPVSMEETAETDRDIPSRIIQLLSGGEYGGGLSTEVPAGVSLLESSMKDGTLTLDLSAELENYGGGAREDGILKQLLHSMKQVRGVSRVQILVDGERANLPEGTDASRPLPVPAEINRVIEE